MLIDLLFISQQFTEHLLTGHQALGIHNERHSHYLHKAIIQKVDC